MLKVNVAQPRLKTFLDIPEAAEIAGMSIRQFRRYIEEDAIPLVHIGRKIFVLRKELDAWKEKHEREVTA